MAVIGVDLTELPESVRKEMHGIFTREADMELVLAKQRQEKIASFYRDNQPQWKEGFGPMVMSMDPFFVSYFAMKYGEDSHDQTFFKWLLKKEEMFRVKAESGKIVCGYR